MKLKITLQVLFFFITASYAYSQRIEITPFAGYMFAGKLNTADGELNFKSGGNYGLIVDFRVEEDLMIELMYNRLDTELEIKEQPFDSIKILTDLSIEYYQAGALYETEKGKFRPFAAFTIGATLFNPADETLTDEWRFSFTAGAGIKYYFVDHIGIRLQWRFMIPVYFSGGAIFCSNQGCGAVLSGGAVLLEYDLTAGLIISL
jgi:opacity protein-like surface antigen